MEVRLPRGGGWEERHGEPSQYPQRPGFPMKLHLSAKRKWLQSTVKHSQTILTFVLYIPFWWKPREVIESRNITGEVVVRDIPADQKQEELSTPHKYKQIKQYNIYYLTTKRTYNTLRLKQLVRDIISPDKLFLSIFLQKCINQMQNQNLKAFIQTEQAQREKLTVSSDSAAIQVLVGLHLKGDWLINLWNHSMQWSKS